jgi:peptidoglycan/xylan/chitin deacetylase (PgdA/CDA1 family)
MRSLVMLAAICLSSFAVWLAVPASGKVEEAGDSPAAVSETHGTSFSEGLVSVTFDDAWRSQYVEALPILEAAGIRGVFYISTQPVDKGWPAFMTREQIKDIAGKGHEIGGHTVGHRNLAGLSARTVNDELTVSKQYLEELTGQTVKDFAYPFGGSSQRIESMVAGAGYLSARGVKIGDLVTPGSNRMNLNALLPQRRTPLATITAAIEDAKAKKRWLILVFHKVDDKGGRFGVSPATFRAVIDAIKAAGIKTVTVSEGVALMEHQAAEKSGR